MFIVVYHFDASWPGSVFHVIRSVCFMSEPASPAPDSDTTMEVDISDVNSDSSRGQDDSEEPSTPEDKVFRDYPFSDQEKDEEPVKAPQIRYVLICVPKVRRWIDLHVQPLCFGYSLNNLTV